MQSLLPSTPTNTYLDQDVYTDLKGLAKLRQSAKDDPQQALRGVAQQFEALFMQKVLKSMRDASFGDPIFDSSQSEFYQDMFDKQISLTLSKDKGMGLADALVRQLRGHVGKPVEDSAEAAAITQPQAVDKPVVKAISISSVQPLAAAKAGNELEPEHFDSPQAFVSHLWPLAEEAGNKLGVKPEVLLAQAALETGWGQRISRHVDGASSYNLFNIKTNNNWDGAQVRIKTLEYRDGVAQQEHAAFRAYDSFAESFADYVNYLQSSGRYQKALKNTEDSETFIRELHAAGYATDPHYADKIVNIMQRPLLQQAQQDMGQGERGVG